AADKRQQHQTAGPLQQLESGLGGARLHMNHLLPPPAVQVLDDLVVMCDIFLALKRLGNRRVELLDKGLDVLLKLCASARRQAQWDRTAFVGEVVDKANVRWGRLRLGAVLEVIPDQCGPPGPGLAEGEQIEALAGNTGSKSQGCDRSWLAK